MVEYWNFEIVVPFQYSLLTVSRLAESDKGQNPLHQFPRARIASAKFDILTTTLNTLTITCPTILQVTYCRYLCIVYHAHTVV